MLDTRKGRQAQGLDLALFYIACLVTILLGGSSRYDLAQAIPLQIGSWLLVAIAAARYRESGFGRPLLIVAALYVAYLAIQLVPLPHGIWTSLPGREPLENLEQALAMEQARPFSMAPDRTLNALGSFGAVLAPMLAALNLGRAGMRHVGFAIVAFGLASALLGMVQILTGGPYLYAITNPSSPVGLMANANHSSVLAPLLVVFLALVARTLDRPMQAAAACIILVLVVAGLLNPSRAGMITLLVALGAIALMWWSPRGARDRAGKGKVAALLAIGFALVAGALALAFAYFRGLPAIDGVTQSDPLGDLRFAILPTLFDMVRVFAPLGSGIGSFEGVYYGFEARELMQRTYLNMAHNDVLQVLIEGGIFMLAFIAAIAAIAFHAARAALSQYSQPRTLALAIGAIAIIVLLASAVDYPLRVPSFQMVVVLLLVMLLAASPEAGDDHETDNG